MGNIHTDYRDYIEQNIEYKGDNVDIQGMLKKMCEKFNIADEDKESVENQIINCTGCAEDYLDEDELDEYGW